MLFVLSLLSLHLEVLVLFKPVQAPGYLSLLIKLLKANLLHPQILSATPKLYAKGGLLHSPISAKRREAISFNISNISQKSSFTFNLIIAIIYLMEKKVEITFRSILIFFAVSASIVLVYYTKDILSILFISLIIVATLSPIADFLTKYLRWRVISVLLIYLVTLILLSGLIAALVPALSSQTQEFVTNLPQYTDQIPVLKDFGQVIKEEFIGESLSINSLTEYITQSSLKIFQFTGSLIGIIGSLLVIIVISFYGLLSEKNIREELKKYLNKNNLKSYWLISDKIYSKLGIWLRSQILLAIIVGLITGVALYLLSVPYALLLGVLAGVLEIIPVLGPVIASIPAIIIGLTVSPFIGLIVVALYILIHQIESYVLVPKVMEKALGLSPVLILSALLIGAKLGGIVGAIIAVPLASAITILVLEIPKINESSSQK